MAAQIDALAAAPFAPVVVMRRDLGNGAVVEERRRPVGVIGANYEARPNVTIDVASQLIKSRNVGVLRTGRRGAAFGGGAGGPGDLTGARAAPDSTRGPCSWSARPIAPGPPRWSSEPALIPLVIIRGSGPTTRELAMRAATHGVRTLAHADGGGVLYADTARRHRPVPGAPAREPRSPRRVQSAQPAADPRRSVGRARRGRRRGARRARHRARAAAPPVTRAATSGRSMRATRRT